MDIQLFQSFLLVAKLSSITQAAEQLNFTQPAVTAQIRTLEDHYGVPLFERIGKKLYITEAGREMTTYAEKLLVTYRDIDTVMQRFSELNNPIRVGVSTVVASYLFSPILLEFQNSEMVGSVIVDTCTTIPATTKGLIDNSFDIAILHDTIHSSQIVQFDLWNEKLVWIVRRDLVIANDNCQDISRYPFVNLRPGSVYRSIFEEVLEENDVHPIIEYSDAEAVKRAVLDGVGASILPYVLVESFLTDGTLVEFTDAPQFHFLISVAFHKSKVLTPTIRALLLIFAEHANIQSDLMEYINAKS